MKKKLSIIITNFNNCQYISKCIESILNQRKYFSKINLIIVDDCSKDKSLDIIKKFLKFKNIRLIKNKKNLGLVKSCNKAIKICNSNYILRVDSDDYVEKNFLKLFFKEINKNYDFIFSRFKIKKGKKLINTINKKINFFNLISCSVAMKTKKLRNIKGYRSFMWEELDLYLRYLNHESKIKLIDKSIYIYRKHKKNMTKNVKWKDKAWNELFKEHGKNKIYKFNQLFKLLIKK